MMEFTSVPIIILICYVIGEVYKYLFKKKKKTYKFIPILLSISGGLLGILIYLTNKEMMMNASNIWVALGIGIVSGASSTGTNQIIKQRRMRRMFRKYEEEYNPKIDFKLIYSINPYLNINENYKEIRNYFHHKNKSRIKTSNNV